MYVSISCIFDWDGWVDGCGVMDGWGGGGGCVGGKAVVVERKGGGGGVGEGG